MKRTRILTLLALALTLTLVFGAVAQAAVELVCETNNQTYPLSSSKIDMTLWYPYASSLGELADFGDGEFFHWYEEKTNVHINFEVPAVNTEPDAFQLLFASDAMPDMVYSIPSSYSYRAGEDKAIEDGYFIDLAQYLHLAPNYSAWLERYPDFKKAAYSDTGKMYGFWGVWLPMYGTVMADQGLAIRKDFLDKVGMEAPVTYDDWYKVLTAFRDQLGVAAPFYTSKFGIDITGEFMAGFDTAPYFYQRDGKVQFGPMDDQYRDYLKMLNQWWTEGLLDKDFATRAGNNGITADNDMMLNDKVGSLVDYGTRLSNTYVTRGATNPDFYLIGVQQPVKQEGDTPKFRQFLSGNNMMHGGVISISADSKHIEEAIKWIDGFYASDVYLNANFGLESQEGVVWYKAPDGHRIGDYDFRYSNPNGTSSATVLVKYWTKNPPVRVESSQIEQSDQNKQDGWKIWSKFEPTAWIPSRITMTSEEGTEFASLYTDIETYVKECNVKFIMGQMSLDNYDEYRDTLKKMNVERCIELKQLALDRFNAR